jgi:hypothetical protein
MLLNIEWSENFVEQKLGRKLKYSFSAGCSTVCFKVSCFQDKKRGGTNVPVLSALHTCCNFCEITAGFNISHPDVYLD